MLLWAGITVIVVHSILMLLLKPALNRVAPGQFHIDFRGPGWIFPLFYFRARNFSLMLRGGEKRDRVYLEVDLIQFWISPLDLLRGRLVLWRLRLLHPVLEYVNRQDSREKNKYLPAPGRFLIHRGRIMNGRIKVTDETRTPRYEMELKRISVKNGHLDVGVPAQVLFTLAQGKALLGDGTLEVRSSPKSGWLVMEGTLGDITSMKGVPFFGSRFYLELAHTRDAVTGKTLIEGQISGSQHDKNPAPFDFEINWDDYRLTMDLGIQKLIEQVINHARPQGISIKSGVILSSRRFFDLIKKDYGDSDFTEFDDG